MTAQDALKALIDEWVAPVLKEHGLRKSGKTFWLKGEGTWGVVNFQSSVASTRDEGRFTVHLAVALERLRESTVGWDAERPSESVCHVNERLGFLLPDLPPQDYWWIIDADTDLDRLGAYFRDVTESIIVPWLKARDSEEKVRASEEEPKGAAPLDTPPSDLPDRYLRL